MSKGSLAPPKPCDGFEAAGVAAEVHPPKSSSAITVGCVVDFVVLVVPEIGAPQLPEISFGVILVGTLPSSTLGAAGFAGSGAPQALLSAPPQGSNMLVLDCVVTAGRLTCVIGEALGAVIVDEDKLKGELKPPGLCGGGDGTFEVAVEVGAGAAEKLLKPSSPNKSDGIDVAAFVCGIGADVVFCVKEKSRPFDGAGLGADGLLTELAKKSPPLKGGGDET